MINDKRDDQSGGRIADPQQLSVISNEAVADEGAGREHHHCPDPHCKTPAAPTGVVDCPADKGKDELLCACFRPGGPGDIHSRAPADQRVGQPVHLRPKPGYRLVCRSRLAGAARRRCRCGTVRGRGDTDRVAGRHPRFGGKSRSSSSRRWRGARAGSCCANGTGAPAGFGRVRYGRCRWWPG